MINMYIGLPYVCTCVGWLCVCVSRRRAAEADRLAGELEQEMNAGGRRSTLLVDQIKEKSSLALRQAGENSYALV